MRTAGRAGGRDGGRSGRGEGDLCHRTWLKPLLDPLRESGWIGNSVLLVSSPPDRDNTVSEGLGCVFHRGGLSRK